MAYKQNELERNCDGTSRTSIINLMKIVNNDYDDDDG